MKNHVKNKIISKYDVVGIWSIIPDPMVSEIIASSGLDFIILDMEHGAFNTQLISESVRAVSSYECSPIVRVPEVDPVLIQKLLDVGAHGIIAPQIRTKDDAKKLVDSCYFSPKGTRGYNPFTRAGDFESNHLSDQLKDGFPLICVIIENMDAFTNLDQLLEIEEIDVFYLGIYDMSCVFDIRGQLDHVLIKDFISKSSELIKKAGKSVGVMIDSISSRTSKSQNAFLVLKPDTYQLKKSIIDKISH